jgi:hypothetical protein
MNYSVKHNKNNILLNINYIIKTLKYIKIKIIIKINIATHIFIQNI